MNPREHKFSGAMCDAEMGGRGRRSLSLWILLGFVLFLASCASLPGRKVGAGECKPDEKIALKDRLDQAIAYLSADEFCHARAEITYYLRFNPRSATAKKLLFASDTDPQAYWGDASFEYIVARGDTLAVLSETHLGDMLLFPMLARYNNISAEGLRAGATIRIPDLPKVKGAATAPIPPEPSGPSKEDIEKARALIADGNALQANGNYVAAYDAYFGAASIGDTALDSARYMREVSDAAADVYHRKAVEAIRDQRPELAIVFWTRALEIAPDHLYAPAGLERAEAIVSNIARFRE